MKQAVVTGPRSFIALTSIHLVILSIATIIYLKFPGAVGRGPTTSRETVCQAKRGGVNFMGPSRFPGRFCWHFKHPLYCLQHQNTYIPSSNPFEARLWFFRRWHDQPKSVLDKLKWGGLTAVGKAGNDLLPSYTAGSPSP